MIYLLKPTIKHITKNEYLHFYSNHNNEIKPGHINVFIYKHLEYVGHISQDEEFKYIKHSLKILKCLELFILKTKKKPIQLLSSNKLNKNTLTIPITHRSISLTTNPYNTPLYDKLTKLGILIISTTSQTIKSLTNISKCTNNITTSHAGICSILCKDCDEYYIAET